MRSHEAMYRFRKPEFLVEDSRASLGIWNHLRKRCFFSGEIFPSILQVVKKMCADDLWANLMFNVIL